ncbi:hypothetical protein HanXRQr2_Chr04g0161081 [Helianthus annuus]|uniref:Uncharacterized protein n=1 Tax=Helianthus annuus TaxID=4232 RepID=A0A9K3NSF8_HELAN|nr:hypothetical protein HanXRQr2_Chr04g0161081 [Helianthus annuus]KAJ0904316.1 hypothetical protein HanPSC8_Chr07g0280701 [Helianthus annuus]KAJ0930915.1 hypothetical protein HanPSC8_Chr04g0155161 [Helianthus annuus]
MFLFTSHHTRIWTVFNQLGFSSFTNKGKLRPSIWFSRLSYADSVARRFTLVRVLDSSDLIHMYIMVNLFWIFQF